MPEVAEALPLEWLGKALSDPAYGERIQRALTDVRIEHAGAIDAFFAAHAEYRGLTDEGSN